VKHFRKSLLHPLLVYNPVLSAGSL
jgi:hypothetical protein